MPSGVLCETLEERMARKSMQPTGGNETRISTWSKQAELTLCEDVFHKALSLRFHCTCVKNLNGKEPEELVEGLKVYLFMLLPVCGVPVKDTEFMQVYIVRTHTRGVIFCMFICYCKSSPNQIP